MFNTNCYGNESIPSYTQGVETPWPAHATHTNQNLFHQHGSNPNAFVGYGLGQVQSKELDLAGVVGMKETSGASSTPASTTNAWHHSHHRMRYSSTASASRGFLPYQMSSLPHYDSQSVDSSHLTHGAHPQFWMTNPNAYSLMQNYNQRDHNTYAERADTSRSTGTIRHNTMTNRTYAVEDQSRNVNSTMQQQSAEVLSQHCQRPGRQSIHQLQQHQQIHHQQEYLRNPITQRERDPCQYTNSSYHQESMRVGVDTTLYHDQHVMTPTQHQHSQYQASQEALRKAENERRAAFTSRQTWPQTWAKAPPYVPFEASQAFLPNHRSSGSAFQPCNKQAGTDPYSMDSIWAKSAVPTPSSHVPHATNHTIPSTNNHIPLTAQTWMHDTTSHLKSNVYRPPQDMNQMTNVPSNFSTNVLNLDTGQVELSMSVVPPDLSLYSQSVPQTQRHRTTAAHSASVQVQPRHRPLPTPLVPQNHVKPVLKEAPPKPIVSSKPTSTARAAGLDVRQFLATWDEDLDIGTPRPAINEADEPEPPEPAATSLVVLDYHTVPSEEAAGLLQMYPDLQLSGNDSVVLLDETPTKTNLDFVLSRAVPTTTSSEMVSAPANDLHVSQSSSAIDVAQSGTTPVASTSDPEKLLNSNNLERSPCSANKSSNVGENQVHLSIQPRSQEALTPLSVCESDSEKQKKTSLRLFRKRKAVSAESDASSQCSEHADEVSAKCMKSDSLSNWFGNDSMDTIDGPIRTPVSVSSAAYDPSSSAAQSPVDSMGVIEEKSAEDSAIPESTAVSVITMNRGGKDRIGRSMPDIFDEVMYDVDQVPSKSVDTGRRDRRDDPRHSDKAEVATNIAGSEGSGERDRESQEQSGRNAVNLDRNPSDNAYQEHLDGIMKKSSPATKSLVAEFDSKEVQKPNEISGEKHSTSNSQIFKKTDLETIFADEEFSRNIDEEIGKKFELDTSDKNEENSREEPQYSEEVPSAQLKPSNNSHSEPTVTADGKRLSGVDNGVMHRSETEFENQRPLGFLNRELSDLLNSDQSKTTTAQTCHSPNEGVGEIIGEPSQITEKLPHIRDPGEIVKCDSIGIVKDYSRNENLGKISNRDPSDFVSHKYIDYAHQNSGDFSSLKRSDFMIQGPSDFMSPEPINFTRREPSDVTSRKPSDATSSKPSDTMIWKPDDATIWMPSDDTSRKPSDAISWEPSVVTSREPSVVTNRAPSEIPSRERSFVDGQEFSGITSREPDDVASREPTVVTGRKLSEVTTQEPSVVTTREPSDVTRQEPSSVTSREPSDVTSREPSDVTSREPSDVTSRDLSDVTSLEPSEVTSREPSDATSWKPSDVTSREPSDVSSREPSDVKSREPSDVWSRERSDVTGQESSDITIWKRWDISCQEPNNMTSGEPSTITSWEPSMITSKESCDVTSRKSSDYTSQELREITSLEPRDFTIRQPVDFTNREPGDFGNWNPMDVNHAPTDSSDPALTDTGDQEVSVSGDVEIIKSGSQEPSKSGSMDLESIEPSSVVSRDSFKHWEAFNFDTYEHNDRVNQDPDDAVNLEHSDPVNLERSDGSGNMGIDNSMAFSADISIDRVGEVSSNITAQEVQNLTPNANVETRDDPPPSTSSILIPEKQGNENEVAPVCRYASSKLSSEGSQKTTQYLSRIVGSAPGKIPKILLSRLKNVRDKKRKNGVVQKLPCIRLTRVQTGTSLSLNELPEYVCREGDRRSEDVGGRRSVSDSPNHELRDNEVQKTVSPVGLCSDFEVESFCWEESRTESKSRNDSPNSLESGELRDSATSSDELPSPERWDEGKDVQEPLRELDGFPSRCKEPTSEDLTFTNSSDPNCVDLILSQAYELSNPDAMSRPATPVSPFEKKMSSGLMFRNKSPDVADRPNQDFLQRRPVRRRRCASKRRFSLPSPKSFEEDASFDSPLQSKIYQTESKVLTSAFKYTLVPVRMRSISADAVESKTYEMLIETKEGADHGKEEDLRSVQEITEKISSSWEEDSRDMVDPELCKNFPEVQKEAEKFDSVYKSPVRSSSDALEIRGPGKDSRRQNSDSSSVSSSQRSRKASPAGFDSPWPGNSRERDSLSSDGDDSSDSSDTSSSSSSKSSRMTSSSESGSSDSDTSSDESSDDDNVARAVKKDISSAGKENVAKRGKEDPASARKEDIKRTGKEHTDSARKEVVESTEQEDTASAKKEDIASADMEEIASPDMVENASADMEEIASAEMEENASANMEEIASADMEEIASADMEEIACADMEEIACADMEEIASADMEEIASADMEEIASADTEEIASVDTEEIASADTEDIASADNKNIASADTENSENDKINDNVAPAADELVQHQAEVTDTFAPENEVQVKASSFPNPLSRNQGLSRYGIQRNEIFDSHASDFHGEQVMQKVESLSASSTSISHSIEPGTNTNTEDHGRSDLPEVSDRSNCHAVTEDNVSKRQFTAENTSLVSGTCQEGAIVNYSSREDDTCPALEPTDLEPSPPTSESTEMPCLEKITGLEDTSDHNVKTDLPQIQNHIDEINGTDVLVGEDTLLVFTDDVENVFVEGEDGCVQVGVQGEKAEFHAVQDDAGDFNVEVQDDNAIGDPVEVQGGDDLEVYDEDVEEVPVEVQDSNAGGVQDENAGEFAADVQDGNAEKFSVEIQDERAEDFPASHLHGEKTEEFHIVVDEEQYNGLCNGTMEVFTSDSMKTFTVESIQEGALDCEEVVSEGEHPDQGDFYCDEIGSAPVEEVVNSETTCDIEGEKVYDSWREEGVDIPAPLESVDNESLVDEVFSEKAETGSPCNDIPLEMKCSLSWDRILNEGQGLVLGPANVEVRVPGESAKETTHWKVVTRERKRPGTSKTSSCVEENNNVMLDVKSPIIVVKRLVLKRPRTRRSQRKRGEDALGDLWKDAAKILPPLKTKGALKAFQAHTEGTHLRNRNRSWPASTGDTAWKRRRIKRRRSDLSPSPRRTFSCSSPQRLPKVIIKKTGPQYQSFICSDDVFMQPVVSIERNAELDNLALTMWSEECSPTSSVGLSPQHDGPDQTKDMGIGNGNQVNRGRRKQPKTGRAGQLMKVVELLQQWRQAEQEAASKVSKSSSQSTCNDSIENNNSLMCIDNNADGDRYLLRYHSSDYSSSSSRECSIANDISYNSNAAREEINGETNLSPDLGHEELRADVQEDKLDELIDSVVQEDKLVNNTADRKEPEENIMHLEDNSGQCDAQGDSKVGSTLQEDGVSDVDCLEYNISVGDCLEENVVEESVLEDNIVEDTVLEDNIVEENVLENNIVEESPMADRVVEDVRDDIEGGKDLLQDSAAQDFVQVENANIQEKQMLDVVAQTDDITEDAILNDNIVEEVIEDESVAAEVMMDSALDENVVKEDMSQNILVDRIVEDIVQEYDNIGKFGSSALQEADSVLGDKTIQEADSAFEATTAQERSSALQEEVVVREADSVLQEDVCQRHVQQGVDISCTEKDIEGNTLSREQSRRTSIEEELGLPLVCQVCGFTTTRLEEQANHIRTHSYHCQRCQLAFVSQEDFKDHLAAEHPTIEELHHCLLCQRTFPTAERHAQHKKGWHHSQMERSQRHTIHSLFRFFTGSNCPYLPTLAPEEVKAFDWLPSDPGVIHFYHDATPLQLAVQDCGGAKDDTDNC